jgi:hypothetical protein
MRWKEVVGKGLMEIITSWEDVNRGALNRLEISGA